MTQGSEVDDATLVAAARRFQLRAVPTSQPANRDNMPMSHLDGVDPHLLDTDRRARESRARADVAWHADADASTRAELEATNACHQLDGYGILARPYYHPALMRWTGGVVVSNPDRIIELVDRLLEGMKE